VYRFEMNPLYKQATLQGIFGTSLLLLSFSGLLGRSIKPGVVKDGPR